MCLILFAYRAHPTHELVVAANRDEFRSRSTAPAAFWEDHPHVFAGRDLRAGGTWMGITRTGRFAALTNFREPLPTTSDAPSRGMLVSDFLLGAESAAHYVHHVASHGGDYSGFNLLVADRDGMYYVSNRGAGPRALQAGIYGMSNHLLDTPWPKVERGKSNLRRIVAGDQISEAEVFALLGDAEPASDALLPDTGVGQERERALSPLFISTPEYGTRSSTLLRIDRAGRVAVVEQTYEAASGSPTEARGNFILSSGRTEDIV